MIEIGDRVAVLTALSREPAYYGVVVEKTVTGGSPEYGGAQPAFDIDATDEGLELMKRVPASVVEIA